MLNFKLLQLAASRLPGVLCLLLAAVTVSANEGISSYHSDIQVRADGSMQVTETIMVRFEGVDINRGIYRDFPTSYKDRLGNRYRVTFNVLDVRRNGEPEPFHVVDLSNGVRVYMGSEHKMLTPGLHGYRLRYHTTRQLGFFENHDELYWNVTGMDWMFSIDRASATVELPAAVESDQLQLNYYTGPQNANGKDAVVNVIDERRIGFHTTKALRPHENLSIAVGWPKGIVREPTPGESLGHFLDDNAATLALIIGLLLPLAWYLWAWNNLGRDPRKGIIIPLYEPPVGLTPAGCSYIHAMSFGRQAFVAAIVSLGIRGYLEIDETGDKFTLRRKDSPLDSSASDGELAVFEALFKSGTRRHIELDQENHGDFAKARKVLLKALKNEHLGRVFNLNSVYALPAIGLSIVAAAIAAGMNGGPLIWIAYAVLSIALHLVFLYLMRAPTPAGRRLMDEIEGFKMYLDTAEQDRLDRMRSPRLTPEVFEMFLPFAFALGVENNWCDRFAREFPLGADESGSYRPHWYLGHNRGLTGVNHLGHEFNSSFSSAIASASSPPGTSSGSGGGGFSGGGGGGGGGGGW